MLKSSSVFEMEHDTQPLQFLICATRCSVLTDRGLHIPKFNQEPRGKHSLTQKEKKKKLFICEATFFVLCPRRDRAFLTHSTALPHVDRRFTGALQQIQSGRWMSSVSTPGPQYLFLLSFLQICQRSDPLSSVSRPPAATVVSYFHLN